MAIVYQHRRKDSNEIFYIGIGKTIKRAYSKYGRNPYWHHIVDKLNYIVEITHKDVIWEEACSIEKYLISFYGRKDLNLGGLINMTDGGEGCNGYITSFNTKNKLSKLNLGHKNPMWNKKMKDNPHWKIKPFNIKKVQQFTLNNEFIAEYNSVFEAQCKTKVAKSSISKCCKNKLKRAGKFIWKYVV